MTLALVAPTFNAVSETFIADHVRTLAPGATVLVCRFSQGAEKYGLPVLSQVGPDYTSFGAFDAHAKDLLFRLRRRFGPPLGFDDRQRVMAFFKEQGVDCVLAEFGYSGVQIMDVCAALKIPLFVYFRGADASASIAHGLTRKRYGKLFRQVRGVFCVSQALADRIVAVGCPPDLITVNPSGVVLADFPPGDPQPGRLVAVGRLVDKKAPHLTLEAFGRIAARHPQAHLDLVGDGPLMERCRETIARHGVAGQVTLHGALPHARVREIMRPASIFVQHSVTAPNGDIEGFPTAIAEAMSAELCVVSTRHSGIPEHVHDGETGLVVDEGDVEGMAAALDRVLSDEGYARALGRAARVHAMAHLDRDRSRQRVRDALGLPAPAQPTL